MPQVDFYISPDHTPGAVERLCCRLAEKAYRAGNRVYIHAESGAQAARLDDLLWTFRDGSFLPHALHPAGEGEPSPVLIGHGDDPGEENDVLINLADPPPPFVARFNRVLEPVAGPEEARRSARGRYRFYRDQGYTLGNHELSG